MFFKISLEPVQPDSLVAQCTFPRQFAQVIYKSGPSTPFHSTDIAKTNNTKSEKVLKLVITRYHFETYI
jgi:hypothetical protein